MTRRNHPEEALQRATAAYLDLALPDDAVWQSLMVRFEKYMMPEPNSGCWLWLGSTDRKGYGQLRAPTKLYYATHVIMILRGFQIKEKQCVCHKCDTPSCVNPDHLFIGTPKDNNADMYKKGRAVFPPIMVGSENPSAKFTERKIAEIRKDFLTGMSLRQACRKHGIGSPAHAWQIRSYRIWKHVSPTS